MTATVAKKPRAAKRRKPKPMTTKTTTSTPMNGCKIETLEKHESDTAISHEVVAAVAKKVAPTSTEQLPVVITEERTKLGLFEIALLPFLYLEKFVKLLYYRFSK